MRQICIGFVRYLLPGIVGGSLLGIGLYTNSPVGWRVACVILAGIVFCVSIVFEFRQAAMEYPCPAANNHEWRRLSFFRHVCVNCQRRAPF